ncbi:uncharacterized protein LOC114869276 isoform X2 [Betta splendens]|uniref:DNA-directed DNA polymerase n=1 Tax=Betta splendens TaxID=158456 RepID=A0A9W2Y936_BETSP|nr:uncharacterized protein LOC114869276 isoform X2 [Betta splendens]
MFRDGVFIQHSLNGGERSFGRLWVDGYCESGGVKVAYEFLGCFYHGCLECFTGSRVHALTGKTFERMHVETQERLTELRSEYGLRVITMKEHNWDLLKKSHQGVKAFLKAYKAPEPLAPRDALYAGRTCPVTLRYSAGEDEVVRYVDFTSLYPYVNYTCPYSLGHPEIIFRDFQPLESYFGLIKATLYPPRGLFFPVLPYRSGKGRLVFTLCRSCGELNRQDGPCDHSDAERALTGVWPSPEILKALEKGYRVAEVIEVWHLKEQSTSLFKEYISTFLKGKQEASGYPADATDVEKKYKIRR